MHETAPQSTPESLETTPPVASWEDYKKQRTARDHLRVITGGKNDTVEEEDPSDFSDIGDIVNVDDIGRGHHYKNEDISGRKAGQFLSVHEMEMIQANKDQIRKKSPDESEPPEPGEPKPPEDEESDIPPEERETLGRMQTNLRLAEHDYAKRTAKSRKSYLGRFCQGQTRIGRTILKIPGAKQIVESTNEHFDTKTRAAREEYERQFDELGARLADGLRELGYEEEQIRALATVGVILRSSTLEQLIIGERKDMSKESNKFVNWWVNSKGLKSKVAKAGIVAGAGLLTGAIAGLALPAYASLLAGGAAGGVIARHVTRRRANVVGADGKTLSFNQAKADQLQERQFVEESYQEGEFPRVEDITDRVEYRTDDEMLGNRRRMKAAVAIGKVFGGTGGIITHAIQGAFGKDPTVISTGRGNGSVGATKMPVDAAPAKPVDMVGSTAKPPLDVGHYQYPWNWAESQFGQGNGTKILQELSTKAQGAGHQVVWHNANTAQAWVEVDGTSNTQEVISILSQFQ